MPENAPAVPGPAAARRPLTIASAGAAGDSAPAEEPPVLRLLRPPPSEPPYDDVLVLPRPLTLVPRAVPPDVRREAPARPAAAPPPPPPVAGPAARRPAEEEARTLRTLTDDLPDARPFATAFVQRLLEVCGGVRPVPQLQRDTSPGLYADLERALARRPCPTGPRPTARDVRSVHVQQRPDGVAEVCATVRRGGRTGALAFRLEGVHGRWLCTQVQGV